MRWAGPEAAEALRDPDTVARLRGTPAQVAAEPCRRRDELGISYFAVPENVAEAVAPVVDRLAGR